jgi:hypothetical protein
VVDIAMTGAKEYRFETQRLCSRYIMQPNSSVDCRCDRVCFLITFFFPMKIFTIFNTGINNIATIIPRVGLISFLKMKTKHR